MANQNLKKASGFLTVAGGVICYLVLGSINGWGNIEPYVLSYLSSKNPGENLAIVQESQPLSFIAETVGVLLAPMLCRVLGSLPTLFLGGFLISFGYLLCSFITEPYLFVTVYSILVGIGAGVLCLSSVKPSWDYFPESKGKVTGIIMVGGTSSTIIFGLAFTYLSNPNNDEPQEGELSFGPDVDKRVPYTFLYLGIVFLVMTVIALAMIRPVKNQIQERPQLSFQPSQILKTWKFWNMFLVTMTSIVFWYFIGGSYKSFGLLYIKDDHYITFTGTIAFSVGIVGRILWTTLMDYTSYKVVLSCCLGCQFLGTLLITYSVAYKETFRWLIVTVFFTGTGVYPAAAIQTSKMYGDLSEKVWPLVFLGITCSSVIVLFLRVLADIEGYFVTFLIQAFIILCSVFLVWLIKETPALQAEEKEFEEIETPVTSLLNN